MVKINKNDDFKDFFRIFIPPRKILKKVPSPLKKFVHAQNQSEMAAVIFCLLTHIYIKSEKMSPPHKDIFSGLPNFFNGELANSQKLRERVPCP